MPMDNVFDCSLSMVAKLEDQLKQLLLTLGRACAERERCCSTPVLLVVVVASFCDFCTCVCVVQGARNEEYGRGMYW